jgi:phospholipase D1/2
MASIDVVDTRSPPVHLSDIVQLIRDQTTLLTANPVGASNKRSSSWTAEERQKPDPAPNSKHRSHTYSSRSGPPRPLDYSLPSSPTPSRRTIRKDDNSPTVGGPDLMEPKDVSSNFVITRGESSFRSVLDSSDRKGKRRANTLRETYPHQWSSDSSKETHNLVDVKRKDGVDSVGASNQLPEESNPSNVSSHHLRRADTASFPKDDEEKPKRRSSKWARLRSLLPYIIKSQQEPGSMAVISKSVTIPDELLYGGLTALMLRLWSERDEKGRRRIPMLFHRMRIRISDSLHPLDGSKSVFRIECDYADGSTLLSLHSVLFHSILISSAALRWVIYRQLRDFISLHTHYRFSNAYSRASDNFPEFPRTSTIFFSLVEPI